MAIIYLGSLSLGDAIPGLKEALTAAGEGLRVARTAVDGAIGQLGSMVSQIQGVANDLESAKDSIVSTALAPALAAVSTAQGLLTDLNNITNPGDYVAALLSQIDAARALVAGLVPYDYLGDIIDGVSSSIAGLQSQALGYVGLGDDLTDLTDEVAGVLGNVTGVLNTLTDANAATLGALVAYSEMASALLNSGVHAFGYTGALSSLGSELDAATPATAVSGSATIGGVILLAKTSDGATVATLNNVFGI